MQRVFIWIAFCACLIANGIALGAPRVVFVNRSAPEGGDGKSWGSAHRFLQDALFDARATATSSSNAVEIWVAKGTYVTTEGVAFPPGDSGRSASFQLANFVSVFGGFSGSESSRFDRDATLNTTTLSGDIGGDDPAYGNRVPAADLDFGTFADNAQTVVTGVALDSSVTLSGFVITGGSNETGLGGAIAWTSNDTLAGGPVVEDCVIVRNKALQSAAISCDSTVFRRVQFLRNMSFDMTGNRGGGVLASGPGNINSKNRFINCIFASNRSRSAGGAIVAAASNDFFFCTIVDNRADQLAGGILAIGPSSSGRFFACVIQDNVTPVGPSDIDLGADPPPDTKVEIHSCTVDATDVLGLEFTDGAWSPVGAVPVQFTGKADFVNRPADNYRLRANAACIDRALVDCVDCPYEIYVKGDFDRHLRAFKVFSGFPGSYDPGAFEYGSPSFARAIHVDPAVQQSGGSGESWSNAVKYLREGIDRAISSQGEIREVWVKEGVIKLGAPSSPQALLNLSSGAGGLVIRGGFTGNETSASQRVPTDRTVLSGDLLGDDDGTIATLSDNKGPLLTVRGATELCFERIVFYSGYSANSGGSQPGAVEVSDSRLTFRQCDFTSNWGRYTPALRMGQSNAIFDSCVVDSNSGMSESITGAIYAFGNSNLRAVSCRFVNNIGGRAGAVQIDDSNLESTFRWCEFVRNRGTDFSASGVLSLRADVLLANCTFFENSSPKVGAVKSEVGTTRAWQCLFVANEAAANILEARASAEGPDIRSCMFVGNLSGSALEILGIMPTGIRLVKNTIFWKNSFSGQVTLSAQARISGLSLSQIDDENPFDSCTVWGWNGSQARGNNGSDPLFKREPVPGDLGDLHFRVGSLCIDSGNDSAVPFDEPDLDADGTTNEILPVDLDGSVRQRGIVDRGPYEYASNCASCPGIREWQSSIASGDFNDIANWFPSVPNSSHDARFGKSQSLTVNFVRNEQTGSVEFARGDTTLDLSGRSWALRNTSTPGNLNAITIDSRAYESTTVRVRGGAVTAGQGSESVVGRSFNSSGILDVSGSASSFSTFGTLRVGLEGEGVLSVLNGGSVTASQLDIAGTPGGAGEALVEGAGSKLKVNVFGSVGSFSAKSISESALAVLDVRNGGVVQAGGAGLVVLPGGRIQGNGTISGSVVSIGEISPGLEVPPAFGPPVEFVGTLTITGDYEQLGLLGSGSSADSGRLTLRASRNKTDVLSVNGEAMLGGVLRISLAGRNPGDIQSARNFLSNLGEFPSYPIVFASRLATIDNKPSRFEVGIFPSLITDSTSARKFLKLGYSNYPFPTSPPQQAVFLGAGNLGSWTPPVGAEAGTAPGTPTAAIATDLDGDGLDDLVVTTSNGSSPGNLYIFFNRGTDGSGAWKGLNDPLVLNVGIGPSAVITAQLRPTPDRTIGQDIVVANQQSGSVMIFRNNVVQSSAGLGETVPANAIGSTPEVIDLGPDSQPVGLAAGAFAPGHFTGDPADVSVSCNGLGVIRLFPNDGSGGLGAGFIDIPLEGGSFMRPISFDQDPRRKSYMAVINKVAARKVPEGAAALPGESQLVLIGNDSESVPPSYPIVATYAAGLNPVDIQVASLQGVTGHATPGLIPDLAVVSSGDGAQQGGVTLLIADQASMQSPGAIAPAYTTSIFLEGQGESLKGNPLSLALVDVDRDGDLDVTVLTKQPTESPSVEILRNDLVVNGQINSLSFSPELETVDVGTAPVQIVGANLTVRNAASKLDILGLNSEVLLRLRAKGGSAPASILAAQVPRLCPADINGDGLVEDADFSMFVVAYDTLDCAAPEMAPYCPADLNLDGLVDDRDFSAFVVAYNALLCV